MLEASNLECIRGERSLFAGVGFRLAAGEMLYLQGSNGSGKTSLMRILCGLSHPVAGEIRWRGQTIAAPGEDYRRELCYLGHHNAIKEELTPLENLLAAARLADGLRQPGRPVQRAVLRRRQQRLPGLQAGQQPGLAVSRHPAQRAAHR